MDNTPEVEKSADGEVERLEGWKAIAAYFDRDIRTVQRWERTEGLPVRRHNHSRQASAYALASELDEWRSKRVPDQERQTSDAGPLVIDPRHEPVSADAPTPSHRRTVALFGVLALGLAVAILLRQTIFAKPEPRGTSSDLAYSAFEEGVRLYSAGRFRDSVAPFERAVAADSKFAAGWAALAKAAARAGRVANAGTVTGDLTAHAVDAANRALELAPNSAQSHLAQAIVALNKFDVLRWRAEARRTLEIDPRIGEAYAALGDSYNALMQYGCDRDEDPELADRYYAQALAVDPFWSPDVRATNLRYLGRYDECVALITEAIDRSPGRPVQREVRGRCRLMAGDLRGAAEDIEPLRYNRRAGSANAMIDLGWLELRSHREQEAVRDLEQASTLASNAGLELTIAYVYGDGGYAARAAVHVERAFAFDRTCRARVATGLAYKQLRQFKEVQTVIKQAGTH